MRLNSRLTTPSHLRTEARFDRSGQTTDGSADIGKGRMYWVRRRFWQLVAFHRLFEGSVTNEDWG
ncbi:MAG: hypothetical protein HWQ35_02665 [Nostoc sp. NMS1]|uniref:hypothetical protein n=1 Tax=unclassified Nostoc TaxID=2593658 RepID=UPI0025FA08ED|nr:MULTISPECIES: hypothetical protein [unclassified Nostoc]MBN3905513.1 hypothetical protein [Nostoc sp. NMS1]MBN3994056.1 hypothetical protein [Nostoc sp. NMS2]